MTSDCNTIRTLKTAVASVGVDHVVASSAVLHFGIVESAGEAGMPVDLSPKLGSVRRTAGTISFLLADFMGFDAIGVVFVGFLELVWSNINPPFALHALLRKECVLSALSHPPMAHPTIPRILGLALIVTYEEFLAVSASTVSWFIKTGAAGGAVRRPVPVTWT